MSSVYQVRITLKGTKPPIWRRVAVRSDITLGQLHEVIQIAMGWTNSHMHQFIEYRNPNRPTCKEIATLPREELDELSCGERYFVTKVTPWGDPTEMDGEDEDAVTLAKLCPKVKSKLIYEYDFGDGWEHTIEVQKIVEPKPDIKYPVCLAGKKACPPEDCGGVWGYYEMLEAIAEPDHDGHEDMLEWLGEEFDPDAFDMEDANAILAEWRGR